MANRSVFLSSLKGLWIRGRTEFPGLKAFAMHLVCSAQGTGRAQHRDFPLLKKEGAKGWSLRENKEIGGWMPNRCVFLSSLKGLQKQWLPHIFPGLKAFAMHLSCSALNSPVPSSFIFCPPLARNFGPWAVFQR